MVESQVEATIRPALRRIHQTWCLVRHWQSEFTWLLQWEMSNKFYLMSKQHLETISILFSLTIMLREELTSLLHSCRI